MRCLILHSLWGVEGQRQAVIDRARRHGFDGLESNLNHPVLSGPDPEAVAAEFSAAGLALVLELVTGNGYVPDLALTPADHLRQLADQLERCRGLNPLRITVISGSDSWNWADQQWFWDRALELTAAAPAPLSFETHRSRSLADPWLLHHWLERYPSLRLSADLSHWCVACERLMTPELAPIQAIADRVDHIHARVGHAQGPQVSHPMAPEHAEALAAHWACWDLFLQRARARGEPCFTLTPEFGPDGYLPTLPFTHQPVADLLEINTAMAAWLRRKLTVPAAPPGP
ncbi:TIM barrel protein [Synechococcus sp. CS-1329]|uniref:sugar phosphate isomerase/epimerase family protein n=1 Tax=Synechococcus sp. CS-1329 TaxID=2847975 RepID=UPI00223AB0AD|nr:sugar phosphate isomerase/epimerase [Synechococcus sp. CS-1329]MCT0217708.1 TIM barrel protein [Synechococcus sp. CS-1329]